MLYIIRHGKTDWNNLWKIQGRTDIPLNEEGRAMAERAAEEYKDIEGKDKKILIDSDSGDVDITFN